MKNFPELEEKYQKLLKIRMEKLKEQKSKQIDDNVDKQQKKNKMKWIYETLENKFQKRLRGFYILQKTTKKEKERKRNELFY